MNGRVTVASAVALTVCALGAGGAGTARADDVASLDRAAPAVGEQIDVLAPPPPEKAEKLEGGAHWRLETQNGVVHVWRPAGYDAKTAGTVVYLHGHRSTADSAWVDHRLVEQFKAAGVNALFIVPDSTTDGEEELHWESLGGLVREVARRTGVARPSGPVAVVGHSGAYRNVAAWLDDNTINHVILLDALYSREEDFFAWVMRARGSKSRMLTLVSRDTRRSGLRFMKRIKESVGVKTIPDSYDKLTKRQRESQVLNFRSQYDHMGIVTSGKVIPFMLKRCGFKALAPVPAGKKPEAVSLAPPAGEDSPR